MTVLITAASKHGSTAEIAKAMQDALQRSGVRAVRIQPEEVLDVSIYDAVILGSAVYAGSWLSAARSFAFDHSEALLRMPVWLFSSGPVGEPPKPEAHKAVRIQHILDLTGARGHALFGGKIDPSRLGFAERAMTRALGVKATDSRDWSAIEAWAQSIAHELTGVAVK